MTPSQDSTGQPASRSSAADAAGTPPRRVLMVCLGNICRSPTAEGVMRARAQARGLAVEVDSAGTAAWHAGSPPDPRSVAHAARRGIDLRSLRARQVSDRDFQAFDLILAMDRQNLAELQRRCPPAQRHKLSLLLTHAAGWPEDEVPDPYYGGEQGFEHVLDGIERACDGLLEAWSRGD